MSPLAGTQLAHFEILGLIGSGGMGEVYRARDPRLGRDVAIKVLPPEFAADPDRLRRFEQEARSVAALDHPNILAIHDVGTHDGAPYIVTELLEGKSLRERLGGGALPARKAVEIGVQIAQGLAAAHEKGIVHRDLKPGNVFITKDGLVKILDFGLAKLKPVPISEDHVKATTVTDATEAGMLLGTVGYMSPEQVRGQTVDQRSDIFSLGCVLYEMLAGRPAFRGETRADTMSAILHEDPPPLTAPGTQFAPALREIVNRCLEKRPEERFSSAHDVALALRVTSGGAETPAPSPAPSRRSIRDWSIALGAAVVVLIAVAFLGVHFLHRGSPTAPQAVVPSIAVLPFTNLSGDKEQEYFSDGLSEELMGLLTKVKQLHVAGRTSSFAFKGKDTKLAEIGRELNVATVLEGSVRRSGDRLRVSTQLVSVADGYQLWAETYDRTLSDVFAVQDDIAGAVVAALKVTLLPQERPPTSQHRTANSEAYNEYLLGNRLRSAGTEEAHRRSIEAYERATALDPEYAAAYAGLALAQLRLAGFLGAKEVEVLHQKALAMIGKALSLEPALPDAYVARGYLRWMSLPLDCDGARADFERAIALDPGSVNAHVGFGQFLTLVGRVVEATVELRRATTLDPLSAVAWCYLGNCLLFRGDLPGTRQALTRAVEISPEDVVSNYLLGLVPLLEHNPQGALSVLDRYHPAEWVRLMCVAMAEHDLGHTKSSQQALDELIAKYAWNSAYQVAQVYAWRGNRTKAFEWLDRAYTQHDLGLPRCKIDPFLAKLRSDPRYEALLRRMHLLTSSSP
jgi:serine/threonine protein kinase/tetratricopeptide (TPR) repeat protein